jgi:hypothetical protein
MSADGGESPRIVCLALSLRISCPAPSGDAAITSLHALSVLLYVFIHVMIMLNRCASRALL